MICISFLLAITGCSNKDKNLTNTNNEKVILKENLNIEINSEINLFSLLSEDNKVQILSEDNKIDTSVLGEKELELMMKKKNIPLK